MKRKYPKTFFRTLAHELNSDPDNDNDELLKQLRKIEKRMIAKQKKK